MPLSVPDISSVLTVGLPKGGAVLETISLPPTSPIGGKVILLRSSSGGVNLST